MFLPTGDTPNPRNFTPWVTYTLIGINIAIYLFIALPLTTTGVDPRDPLLLEYIDALRPRLPGGMVPVEWLQHISAYDLYVYAHGYKPAAAQWSDLLYSMFLHGGLLHLLGNMLFLWIYGDNVEHRLGRFGYLLAYLGSGIVATLFFALFARGSMLPLVGASGAISGVLGLYFLLFPRNQVKVFIFLFPFLFDVFLLPARLVLGMFLLIDNLLPFIVGAQSGVAYGAHIGGFLAGTGVAWVGERLAWQWPWSGRLARGPSIGGATEPPDERPVLLRRAVRDGDADGALSMASTLDPRTLSLLTPRECVKLAGWMEHAGFVTAAARLLRNCLAHHRRSSDLAEVYLELGLLRLRQGQEAAAYQYLLDVLDQAPDPETEARAREALSRINLYRRRPPTR